MLAALMIVVACTACRNPTRPRKSDIPQGISPELRREIERTFSADPLQRGAAAIALGEMGEDAAPAVPFLIPLLADYGRMEYDTVSLEAQVALRAIGEAAVPELIEAFQDSCVEGRELIPPIIADVPGEAVTLALITGLDDANPYHIQNAACDALGERGDRRSVSALLEVLKHEDADMRGSAAWALGATGDPSAGGALLKVFEDDESEDVRRNAAVALGELQTREAFQPLLEALQNDANDDHLRRHAASALGQLGTREALQPLLETLKNEANEDNVRAGAAWGLGDLKRAEGFVPLVDAIQDKSLLVRIASVQALGDFGNPRAIPHLIPLLADVQEDFRVAVFAALSLGQLGGPEVKQVLARVSEDKRADATRRWVFGRVLREMELGGSIEDLEKPLWEHIQHVVYEGPPPSKPWALHEPEYSSQKEKGGR